MADKTPRKPDYQLRLSPKDKGENKTRPYTVVGAAWKAEYGLLTIKLNPGVVLDWRMMEEFFLGLVPVQDNRDAKEDTNDDAETDARG